MILIETYCLSNHNSMTKENNKNDHNKITSVTRLLTISDKNTKYLPNIYNYVSIFNNHILVALILLDPINPWHVYPYVKVRFETLNM